jgi:CBS domain-containing protein
VALLRHHRIGSLPVVKAKQLVGIITRSDILDFVLSGAGIKVARKKARKKMAPAKRGKRSKVLSTRRTNKIL